MSTRTLVKLGCLSLAAAMLLNSVGGPRLWAEDKPAADKPAEKAAADAAPRIQLAILLDTSNSMDGLINQARTQIWKIVNTLATAKQAGKSPDLEVALYEYGKSSLPKDQQFVRKIIGFTDDLDKISEELFALKTNGGEEYCGAVIDAATRELEWTKSDGDLKLIYVCGNEPFTQGPVDYRKSCEAAVKRGITVNTIFCGNESEGVSTGWKDGAQLADGSFLSINQDRAVAQIKTPFDAKLTELSGAVNKTYLAYGATEKQAEFKNRQEAQDKLARSAAPAAAAERAAFKGSGKYANAASDLVDAISAGRVKLDDVKEEELPDEVKKLKPEERKAYIEKKQAERKKIQEEIKELNDKRNAFIAEERKKEATTNPADTLDAALIKSIRDQAAKRKYQFDGK
jgi:hypothetical protein